MKAQLNYWAHHARGDKASASTSIVFAWRNAGSSRSTHAQRGSAESLREIETMNIEERKKRMTDGSEGKVVFSHLLSAENNYFT
ncbi:unnamed protein product, partial [Urochloa humidicola]